MFASNLEELQSRKANWEAWRDEKGNDLLRKTFRFGKISWRAYGQGLVMKINRPLRRDAGSRPVIVRFPKGREGLVPKGIALRLDLLEVLNQLDQVSYLSREEAVYAFIDGSGAFKYESLELVLNALLQNEEIDVAFGRRPKGSSGMPEWRKAIEEFEQYLLIRQWGDRLIHSYPSFDATKGVLPDGQAGCWAFRLRAAKQLALTARHYEIELDLLTSAIDSGLRIAFSEPLMMSKAPRSSEASSGTVTEPGSTGNSAAVLMNEKQEAMHLTKLKFIKHKLGLTSSTIIQAKLDFCQRFSRTTAKQLPANYWKLVESLY